MRRKCPGGRESPLWGGDGHPGTQLLGPPGPAGEPHATEVVLGAPQAEGPAGPGPTQPPSRCAGQWGTALMIQKLQKDYSPSNLSFTF